MNKEEKKAIESIKFIQYKCRNNETIIPIVSVNDLANAIETVLNLIEKQQKEIKELKKKSYKCEYLEEGAEEIIKNSISKDKIREKIKELRKKEDIISNLNYELEQEKAIDCILMRIADLQELLKEENK